MEVDNITCHVCGGNCTEFTDFSEFRQVTSDCRPYKRGGTLAICRSCGLVQRPVNSLYWQQSVAEIYSSYQLFSQGSDQLEESIFQSETGTKKLRSQYMIAWLDNVFQLSNQGSILDIGCGNGGFLASFSSYRPQWNLTGLDINDKGRNAIESISNAQFIKGSVEILDREKKYDLIVLSHTLEHIPHPQLLLRNIIERLSENGTLFLQVPDLASAPFDILVADHCSFFTTQTLSRLVSKSEFDILSVTTNALPKEISLVAQKQRNLVTKPTYEYNITSAEIMILDNLRYLKALRHQAQELGEDERHLGIFGSSISSSWLFGECDNAQFFVDENSHRIGNTHLDLPILSPRDLTSQDVVLMPFRFDIAQSIANRLHNSLGLEGVFICLDIINKNPMKE